MKKFLAILLFFATVLSAVGQNDKNSPTESYLQTKDPSYTPKVSKNEFYCDFELLLSASGTYKRKIGNKTSIGVTMGLGFALVNVWNREGISEPATNLEKVTQKMQMEGLKIGLVVSYQLTKKIHYEFSPQMTSFFDPDDPNSFFGIKNGLFFPIKGAYLGFYSFVGTGFNQSISGFIIYTSLIILRIPLKQW